MKYLKIRRIPAVLALALCLGLVFATFSPVYGQAYRIQPGDTLWGISRQFGVTIDSLRTANNLSGDLIVSGRTLEIPKLHTVQRGDTLFQLARRYSTTVNQLINTNNLKSTLILVGQKLIIPAGAPQGINVTNEEMDLLARTVYSEARGEPFQGQVAVAAVVLNRVRHPEFPNSIRGVIFEPWAFTAVNDGQFWLTPNQTAYAAVREALDGNDPSNGAIFYFNPVTATNQWIRTRPVITQIGRHVFAR